MINFNPYEKNAFAFDIDGIFLDTPSYMWEAFMQHFDLNIPISKWTVYHAEELLNIPKEKIVPVYEPVLARETIFAIPGAVDGIRWLYKQTGHPILFITARRKQFCQAAVKCIEFALGGSVEFEVICTSELLGDINYSVHSKADFEDRNNKTDLLREHGVKFYMEDNYLFWDKYLNAEIYVGTLNLPWTKSSIKEYKNHNLFKAFNNWYAFLAFLKKEFRLFDSITNVVEKYDNVLKRLS